MENYIIINDALYRMFKHKYMKKYSNIETPLSNNEFKDKILAIFEELKDNVKTQIIARGIKTREPSIDESTIISQVSRRFEKNWINEDFRRNVVPGKDFFAKLNGWMNDEYHITISVGYAFSNLRRDEIEPEISNVIHDFIQLISS